ncbi:hypothetical protein [uncultured Anaerococcus sp.]|uniref:hypothetical protein n=1 Tax=uncultured Anaerococcus sp. TaxID=293428 RepID=UPI002606024B|nr:hypothetical protein [uncultured Anaerococcus sp.]
MGKRDKEKAFKKKVIFYILQIILAGLIIYQSLERNIGGLIKEFNPLGFGIGIVMIIMDLTFLYIEWKTYKSS